MEYTKLGATGVDVSRLCLGTWRFGKESDGVVETDREQAHDLLDAFADAGGNFIDTANGYGDGRSEAWIGEWLDERDREDYVLASKVYWTQESRFQENLSRKTIRAEIEGTLDRLGTDYLDVYYIHRWDDETPITETLDALTALVDAGKVHSLGASTMAAWQLTKALWKADTEGYQRFDVTQPLYHAAYERDVADYLSVCADQDLAVCPYSPLAGGFLTGKYERAGQGTYDVKAPEGSRGQLDELFSDYYVSERGWHVLDAIRAVADELDATPAQVALRWLVEREAFTCVPIVGARTTDQLAENLGAVDISLSDDQRRRIRDARYDESGDYYETSA
ncbi:aldo/keto reductase [Halarchaeum nitratireducens]|uniref:Aryl-alcohol dehydrogenase n=1 Tax=Halarchaeum nitratireducens TaxID=489913 RepID=A0A830G987_9EURY|nr:MULTISPECIES: aldo/keto reductase [Halarchaeum]MBP2249782.1 aryl-alcohol dehydrogenase-like predicted oxidoreductase [Halarchaeum solikamskense]GGN10615.1 aryl-alcohol dehydrogenase [Halarchaeum nitratireducens]